MQSIWVSDKLFIYSMVIHPYSGSFLEAERMKGRPVEPEPDNTGGGIGDGNHRLKMDKQ